MLGAAGIIGCTRVRSLAALRPDVRDGALRTLIPWDLQRRLEAEAPARWTAPTGKLAATTPTAAGAPRRWLMRGCGGPGKAPRGWLICACWMIRARFWPS